MFLEITWSAMLEDDDAPCVTRRTTQILSVIDPDAQDAAATAFKWWLEEDDPHGFSSNWDAAIGDDATATAHVVIHAPPEMAGCYAVEVEHVITARGYEADPDTASRVAALLAESEAV